MAAYAALVSLMNTMEKIQNHHRLSTTFDTNQFDFLGEKIRVLLDFVENYSSNGSSKEEAADLEGQIASAAHAAEDVIESHVVDQIHAGYTENSPSFLLDLQKAIANMESIKDKVMEIKEKRGFNNEPIYSIPAASTTPRITGKTTVVGFDGYLTRLLDVLTIQQSDRQIFSIVGMGGIGKTTLARNVYDNPITIQHFDVRVWVTVSQHYNVQKILSDALSFIKEQKTEGELDEQLHKSLWGRRYLIVLDDMWSIEAWDKINLLFPNNGNGSRIVVTTRLSNVAVQIGPSWLAVNFLDEGDSWDLFCEKAFSQEGCPPELEEIGKKIVKKCKGLPLSIVVIGGLMGKSSRKQEYWENIASATNSIMDSEADDHCFEILSLSYSHLPACLRPCFLYLGIFPEDPEIRFSRLIKLWVAEGILKPNKDGSLEKVAEGYIKDLIDRNLIFVRCFGSTGKFKTCSIHDLLREFCIRVAEKEDFFCVVRALNTQQDIDKECRIVIHERILDEYPPRVFRNLKPTSLARSLICDVGLHSFKSRLLRVLVEVYGESLDETFQQVNLRFLAYESIHAPIYGIGTFKLPTSISLLWNVQTLIIGGLAGSVVAPVEIWEMPQLRHLEFNLVYLSDPPSTDKRDIFVLQNLQTLRTAVDFKCSEEVCKRMPNIKKLHILYNDFSREGETSSCYRLSNIGCFNELESLSCSFYELPNRGDLLQNLKFPRSLKKLSLEDCGLCWDDLTIIGSLPYIEVLKLYSRSFTGPTWDPVEGEFLRLKFLGIYNCSDLIYWNADESHFPVLEKLVLQDLSELDEIPSGIGEIPTLQVIDLDDCSISAAISVVKILEEQESFGNEGLQVKVFLNKRELEEFRKNMESAGFSTSHNIEVGHS